MFGLFKNKKKYEPLVISVGQESPWTPAPVGSEVVGCDVDMGFLAIHVHLPKISSDDKSFFEGMILGIGRHQTDNNKLGTITVLLTKPLNRSVVWQISAPISGAYENLMSWGDPSQEDNHVVLVLIDSSTNCVAAIRHFGAPFDFINDLRSDAIMYPSPISVEVLNDFSSIYRADKTHFWLAGRRWLYDEEVDEFLEQQP